MRTRLRIFLNEIQDIETYMWSKPDDYNINPEQFPDCVVYPKRSSCVQEFKHILELVDCGTVCTIIKCTLDFIIV